MADILEAPPAHDESLSFNWREWLHRVYEEIEGLSVGAVSDHGGLTGLADDDHTQYILINGTRAFTGSQTTQDLVPDADGTRDLGTDATARYRRVFANIGEFHRGNGTSITTGGNVFGNTSTGNPALGLCQIEAANPFGTYGAFAGGAATKSGSGTGQVQIRATKGGCFAFGGAFTGADHNTELTASAYGAFVQGYAYSQSGPSKIESTFGGAFAQGYAKGVGSLRTAKISSRHRGAFAQGFCQGYASANTTLEATNVGAFAQGYVSSGGTIQSTGSGAFGQGWVNYGGILKATNKASFAQGSAYYGTLQAIQPGAFAQGYVYGSGSSIQSNGNGSFAQGYVPAGSITASGHGSMARGFANNASSLIQASAQGSFASGYARAGYDIVASGQGSFAVGKANSSSITASATNAAQFGEGTNATADSLQVGSDFLAKANGQHGGKNDALTLGVAATTFAATSNVMTITGDGGGNTIATITGGIDGQHLTLIFVDGNVTITDDNTHAANSVDLSAAFTSADDTVLQLVFDNVSWYEVSRSVN